jgi:hypothetical protein
MSKPERFFLGQDNDCHWYVIPDARRGDWEMWLAIPDGDEHGWDVPEWAKCVGGSPGLVTFLNPTLSSVA